MKNQKVLKMAVLAMLIALGVVISPILRVEGMCPMAHFINITCAVLLGPYYALLCAFLIGVIRMAVMGIPPLAEGEKLECMAKIRYQHKPQKAFAEMADGRLRITFEQPVRAATPGQSAVLYDDERRILCGGFITR